MANWWDTPGMTHYGTRTITFANGRPDYEKGDVFGFSGGEPITLPIAGKVAWADAYQAVIQTPSGVLNFMHLEPSVKVGEVIKPGDVIGHVTTQTGYYTDPTTHHWYQSVGHPLEVGLYDTVQRAVLRDNPDPTDFTGIRDPTPLFRQWDAGKFATAPLPPSNGSGDIHIGPITIPNPISGVQGDIQSSLVTPFEQYVGKTLLTAGLAGVGVVLFVVAVKRILPQQSQETQETVKKVAVKAAESGAV